MDIDVELSGMDLRRALSKALGWESTGFVHDHAFHEDRDVWVSPDGRMIEAHDLPAMESSPAVFFPAFEAWLQSGESAHFSYSVQSQMFDCWILGHGKEYGPQCHGRSMVEAGARAWLLALAAQSARQAAL